MERAFSGYDMAYDQANDAEAEYCLLAAGR
jgi:hypothetical protein